MNEKSFTFLRKLKNKNQINNALYNNLRPVGSQPEILYGFANVHKNIIDACPDFRPILSAIATPTYKTVKFPIPILKDLTSSECSVK